MPINMSNSDIQKMADGVALVLNEAMAQGKPRAFVKTRDFFASLQFSTLRLVRFDVEVADYMTSFEAHKRFGEWVFTEYGDGYSVFIELAKKGEPSGLDAQTDRDDTYFLPPNSDRHVARRVQARAIRGNVADMHDEDIRREAARNPKA